MIDRDPEADDLLALAEGGHSFRLVGPRRYGKTTLLRRVLESAEREGVAAVLVVSDAAIATSGRYERGDHVVDPRTGRPATPVWRTVTVAAQSCLLANAVTTASVVRGSAAPDWVGELGLPGRFVAADGAVVTTAGWPRREAA